MFCLIETTSVVRSQTSHSPAIPSVEVILIGSLQAQCPAGETMDTGVHVHLLQQPCTLSTPPHGNKQRRTMCPAKSPKLLRNETLR